MKLTEVKNLQLIASLAILCLLFFFITIANAESPEQMEKSLPKAPEQMGPPEIEGMVFVQGGCFDMGDIYGDGDPDEIPVHRVCIDDFYIGVYEVTQRQWFQVMGANPSSLINCDECPVENVSYLDVREFIRRLNRMSAGEYRLPTEAEWEYAARSGGKKEMWTGVNSENELKDYAWFKVSSDVRPHPVGQKKANGLGLYDMCGNVQEWVSDYYISDFYGVSPKNNPKGPSGSQYRVVRGGSFLNKSWGIRTSIRYRFTQDDRGREFGFRLAASPK